MSFSLQNRGTAFPGRVRLVEEAHPRTEAKPPRRLLKAPQPSLPAARASIWVSGLVCDSRLAPTSHQAPPARFTRRVIGNLVLSPCVLAFHSCLGKEQPDEGTPAHLGVRELCKVSSEGLVCLQPVVACPPCTSTHPCTCARTDCPQRHKQTRPPLNGQSSQRS